MRRLASVLGCLALLPNALPAQPWPKPAAECARPDPTAEWFRRQRDWWALDAEHDWSNDSLRTELLAAAAELERPAEPFPLQYGAEVLEAVTPPPSSRVLALRAVLQGAGEEA
jgi:hypothetical protein